MVWQEEWDAQIKHGGTAARQSSPAFPQSFSSTGPVDYGPDAWVSLVTAEDKDLLVCFESKQREWKGSKPGQPNPETVTASQILENVAEDMSKTHLFDPQDLEKHIPGVPTDHCATISQAYLPSCSWPHHVHVPYATAHS